MTHINWILVLILFYINVLEQNSILFPAAPVLSCQPPVSVSSLVTLESSSPHSSLHLFHQALCPLVLPKKKKKSQECERCTERQHSLQLCFFLRWFLCQPEHCHLPQSLFFIPLFHRGITFKSLWTLFRRARHACAPTFEFHTYSGAIHLV